MVARKNDSAELKVPRGDDASAIAEALERERKLEEKRGRDIGPFGMNALQPIEQTNVRHRLNVVTADTEPEDLELGLRWSVVAQKLRSLDVVEVVGYGGRWWAEVLVIDARRGCAPRVKVLRSMRLDGPAAVEQRALPEGHEIRFDPQQTTYMAWRTEDNVPMTPPQRSYDEAFRLLINHASLRGS